MRFKLILCLCLLQQWSLALAQMLNPPYFNLAEGRNITASSTCGENVPERELYCKLVGSNWLDNTDNFNLIEGQACDYCDPNDEKRAHPAQYAIDGTERWWQSPPLSRGLKYNEVNLTIDLGQEFNVAYVFIKMGNSPRPGIWVLERSRDHGKTFTPWQYFADTPADCMQHFGQLSLQPITKDDSIICEVKFSKLVPLEGGEIAISLLTGRPSADNFSISATLQDWSTATNIRLRFIRPKTTLGHLLSVARQDPTVTRRYFYSIKDINIGGRCVCNGHASQCDQISPLDPYKVSCSCQHNTCGSQCEQCCPGYQQYKWRRATINDSFVCEKCNCNGHSDNCYYDEEIANKSQSMNIKEQYVGGGVCLNCQHNTAGINCDKCKDQFYRPYNKPIDAIDVCQPCQCDLRFSTGNCYDGSGLCECRTNYQAPNCDKCSYGYFGYPECQECHCFPNGTYGNVCELISGDCPCRDGFGGKFCKECSPNYFGFPACEFCSCDLANSLDNNCNSTTGQCNCKTNYGSRKCDQCSVGYYNYPRCEFCQCDRVGSTDEICDSKTGSCFCKPGYDGPTCSQCSEGYHGFPNCVKCDCNLEGSLSQRCDKHGKCQCKSNYSGYKCDDCSPGYFNFPKCVPCHCYWGGSIGESCDHSGNCICKERFEGQKCDKCKEGYYNFPSCEECNCNPAGLVAEFGGCDKVEEGKLCECKDRVKGRICNQCKDLYWNLQMNNPHGCEECHCNPNGTVSQLGLCDSDTGQCFCKQNVQGRTCNICTRNTYLLDSSNLFGCGNCNCDIGGSINAECDRRTGQCLCKPRIRGQTCSDTIEATYYPTFYQFIYEAEDWYNPTGSRARFGYDEELFPDYSWRGYATFNHLQKEIFTNISISKVSIYRVIVRYINRNNEPVNGILKFTPNEWMNEEEQSIPITFEPSASPKLLFVTGKKLTSGTATLGAGPWRISLKSDKYDFYVDYVVLIPQAYYDQSLFKDKPTDPCIFESTNSTCLKYAYPRFPESVQTFNAIDGYTIEDESETKPSIIKDESYNQKLNSDSGFVKLDNKRKNLILDIGSKNNGTYLAVVNYHTPSNLNKTILLDVNLVNVGKNQSTESLNVLPACPYLFACRHILTNNDGQMLTLDTSNEESYQLKLNLSGEDVDDYDLRTDSIVLVPLDLKWSFDYVKPKNVCTFKNSSCVPANFPSVFEGVKIEAEAESNRDIAFEESEYNPNKINDDIKPKLVKLGNSTQTIDIRGFVTEPGLYSFVLHYYQPNSPSFEVETLIQNGHFYSGIAKVEHCPNVAGCRVVLKQRDNNSTFFFIQKNFMITLRPTPASELNLDYILVIPGNDFNEQMLSLAPTDGSKSFLSDCLQSNYYMEPDNMSEYCRSIIFSIVVDFNGGALPCQCNIDGSFDHKCKSFGGQCNCKPNVIGRDCTMCKTGYYGFPNCRKCNCPSTAVCHPKTGDCICPKGVTGESCDKCLPLTFGFDKIIGCVDCACNSHGVENRDLNCDLETGNCKCKSNIVGRICDKCKAGFYGFPECQLCRCDIRGSTEEICDQRSARCFCKSNVDGNYCDKCKVDSYNLEESNYHGCTKCFCFGNTDQCTSSSFSVAQVTTKNKEWSVYNITVTDKRIDAKILKKNEDYGFDYSEGKFIITPNVLREVVEREQDVQSSIYIDLPKEYLENKIISYGGNFNYKIINKMNTNEEFSGLVSPDIIFVGKNITIIHEHHEQPQINEHFPLSIRMLEKEFKHLDGHLVTREQLMMVLVNLQAIYLRIKFFDPIHEIVLQNVQMDIGIPGNRISDTAKALSVEQCICPPNYKGTSCEECAEGYYRVQKGPYLGACIPCNCNGHSNECDPVTGKCFNCKYSTEGDYCERCIEGYHGDATRGTPHDCIICACPLPITSNNFATSCEVSMSGSVLNCNCKDGYNGTRCDYCAAGYYGQPQISGHICRKCECNNNIDTTDPSSCDSISGKCLKCLNKASGDNCERCTQWFYGDSIVSKNCTECSCDQCGSENCDHSIGDCKCKTNVIGKTCDKCAPGHYGFSECQGCKACNCNIGAQDRECDETGQCNCKQGVTGKSCNTCAAGFWGFSKYGCTSCMCNEKFSRAKQCNQFTGQCQCLPGVIGEKCEHCPDRWVLVPESGCQECGNCIHVLLNDTDELQTLISPIQNDIQDTSSSVLAYKKLTFVKSKYENYTKLVQEVFANTPEKKKMRDDFENIKSELNALEENIYKADLKSDSLEKTVINSNEKALQANNDSVNLDNNVKLAKQFSAQVIENINRLEMGYLNTSTMKNLESKKKESEQILDELNKSKIEDLIPNLDNEISKFNKTLENSLAVVEPSTTLKENIQNMSGELKNITVLISELKNFTQKARENTINAEKIFKGDLKQTILDKIATIKKSFDETNELINSSYKYNNDSQNEFDSLDIMKIDIEQQKTKLNSTMTRLNESMNQTRNDIPQTASDVNEAVKHARSLQEQSIYLQQLFASTKNQATDPLRAANAYNNISTAISDADVAINDARQTLEKIPSDLNDLNKITADIVQIKSEATDTLNKITKFNETHSNQRATFSSLFEETNSQTNEHINLNTHLDEINIVETNAKDGHDNIKTLISGVEKSASKVNDLVDLIESLSSKTKTIERYSNFLNDVKDSEDKIKIFSNEFKDTKLASISENYDNKEKNHKLLKDSIAEKISELKQRIKKARHIANHIPLGVEFASNSSLKLNNPANLAESSTYTQFSMQFLTKSPDGLLAFIGNPVAGNKKLTKRFASYDENSISTQNKAIFDYMCLEIKDKRVVLTWNLGSDTSESLVDSQEVFDERRQSWNQVIVERFGKLVKLMVKTNKETTENKLRLKGKSSIFNLDRQNSNIFIGGISSNVPVNQMIYNRNFEGQISNVILDNEPLGLWNLNDFENIHAVVARVLFTENSLRFNGNGYVILSKETDLSESNYINLSFKTFAKNGLIFLVGDPETREYLSIEINNGKIILRFELGSAPVIVTSSNTYNDGKWHFVKVNRDGKEGFLFVDQKDEQVGFGVGLSTDLSTNDNIYIGGFPGRIPYYDVIKQGFEGCIKELQIGTDQQNINNNKESHGISPGCSTDFIRIASFNDLGGFVLFKMNDSSTENNQITFKFRTLSTTGLLLNFTNSDLYLSIHLSNGGLIIKSNQKEIIKTENHFYNDNKWHYVTIEMEKSKMNFSVDDDTSLKASVIDELNLSEFDSMYVGGMPESQLNEHGKFTGCIGDITLNERYANFAEANDKLNAFFSKCSLSQQEDEFILPELKQIITTESITKPSVPQKAYLEPIGTCKLAPIPKEENENLDMVEEVRFGDTLWSRYEFSISNDVSKGLESESGFQIKFKTNQATGIIFYLTSSNNIDFVGLYFINNKLHYSFDCGSGRGVIALSNNYADGQWHLATFSRKGKNGLLRVDEETMEVSSVGSTSSLNVKSPIYVGGVPEELSSQVKGHLKSSDKNDYSYAISSFSGCLKDLKVRDIEYKFKDGRGVNVASCSNEVEIGNFFHYDGGYIHLFEEMKVGILFSLTIQIKPRKPTGILAAVFGKTDFLVLYMDNEKVIFSVDNGANPIIATKDLKDKLCDGNWHTIKAVKMKNIAMLTVDDMATSVGTGYAGISSTDTKSPLYIGGLPTKIKDEKKAFLNSVTDDYLGCLRIKEMNDIQQSINNIKVEGHITLNSCPLT